MFLFFRKSEQQANRMQRSGMGAELALLLTNSAAETSFFSVGNCRLSSNFADVYFNDLFFVVNYRETWSMEILVYIGLRLFRLLFCNVSILLEQ